SSDTRAARKTRAAHRLRVDSRRGAREVFPGELEAARRREAPEARVELVQQLLRLGAAAPCNERFHPLEALRELRLDRRPAARELVRVGWRSRPQRFQCPRQRRAVGDGVTDERRREALEAEDTPVPHRLHAHGIVADMRIVPLAGDIDETRRALKAHEQIPRRQRNLRAADRVAPGIEYRSPKEIRIAERETHRHARSSREAPDVDALRVDRIARAAEESPRPTESTAAWRAPDCRRAACTRRTRHRAAARFPRVLGARPAAAAPAAPAARSRARWRERRGTP